MANHRAPIPTWVNETYMQDILRKHFNQPTIKVQTIVITPGSKEGDNYACQVLRIKLNFIADDGGKQISIIGKIKIESESLKAADSIMDFFLIEAAVYSQLFPIINKLKAEKNFAPECYHVDYEHKTLFLEDLGEKQFVMPTRGQLLNKDEALLTMEALASLHGASYIAVQADPSLKVTFQESMWGSKPNELIDKWYDNAIRGLEKNLASYGLTEGACKILRGVGCRMKKESLKVADFQDGDLNVICHGDIWLNNLMYHFTDGVIDQVLILDFQFATYRSFATDLHLILFSSVQADVLVSDLDTLIETYYNKLKMVAPEIPNLTLEMIKKEFLDKKFFGCVNCVHQRSFVYATTPLDNDSIVAGVLDEMGFKNPAYIEDLHKLVPFLKKRGFFSENS